MRRAAWAPSRRTNACARSRRIATAGAFWRNEPTLRDCNARAAGRRAAGAIDDADAAEGLRCHLGDRLRHAAADYRERDLAAGMHDVAHEFEHRAEPAAGVQAAEVDGGEAAALQQRDRDRVAERRLHQ